MTYQVKYAVKIDQQRLADLMCGALEGGSTYWCVQCQIDWEHEAAKSDEVEWGHEAIAAGVDFTIWHNEEAQTVMNGKKVIERALQQMADEHPEHFANFVGETDDAETSDVFFQVLCFGEIVYG